MTSELWNDFHAMEEVHAMLLARRKRLEKKHAQAQHYLPAQLLCSSHLYVWMAMIDGSYMNR